MKIGKKARLAIALGLTGMCFALVQIDLAPHRKALDDLRKAAMSKMLMQQREDLTNALRMYADCSGKRPDKEAAKQPRDYRECLLSAMPKVKTEFGATAFALSAAYWLEVNPNDKEVRLAATKVVEAGWEDLRRNMPLYELMDKVAIAHDQSIILRAMHGFHISETSFEVHASGLERVELRLNAPELMQAQVKRRLSLIQ